ncbi:FtsK/SpoIIIE domain-containing protein [Natronoglycomyces albus]|uniref:TraM recognition domain-containing protein n=1 Tax=Natronoglycomyces albus TaxID=2811108 RepID=A0A895XNG7_9ACTN|nr:FtsK/SpoIIIE domain-containing protein [Natronoglycomyces albus]QSB04595.1 TraM recognition domain-containing protein [Natronoglycomyces albus]
MGWRAKLEHTAAAIRAATWLADEAGRRLEDKVAHSSMASTMAKQREIVTLLHESAIAATPGWLGLDISSVSEDEPLAADPPGSSAIRLGRVELDERHSFPALVRLVGSGHLVVDGDAADARVSSLLQTLMVRLVAAYPKIEFSLVDGVTLGQVFAPCAPLVDAGIAEPVATDHLSLGKVLTEAEKRIQEVRDAAARSESIADQPYHVIVVAGLPPQIGKTLRERIAAIAHAGPRAHTHVILCGWRSALRHEPPPAIEGGTYLSIGDDVTLSDVPLPVELDEAPSPGLMRSVFGGRARQTQRAATLGVEDLIPEHFWAESSAAALTTVIGRDARGDVPVSFDDATPHWLIGGRTGAGKTVFLLDVLYSLSARYGPDELALYLLDFKEGVSFSEFTPSMGDESWIPQVKAVGVESDREYGVAVLEALRRELSRRASIMKRAGATRLAKLRQLMPDEHLPRIVAVIDEFHVLFNGNDRLARTAVAHLEELARKGRSYGVHLVLASQTISGIEALYAKKDSIFGQFPLRVALPGASHLLDERNESAEGLTVGQAVINTAGGAPGWDRTCQFPDASASEDALAQLRHKLWSARDVNAARPVVFQGFDEQHLVADPTYRTLSAQGLPRALIGRAVDVDVSTVSYTFDASPGRHLAVLGTSTVGVDVVSAAALSVSRQHEPGSVNFVLAPLVAAADEACAELESAFQDAGHSFTKITAAELRDSVMSLNNNPTPTYLVLFGADAAATTVAPKLLHLMQHGPSGGVHVLGWWRGARRFATDMGGPSGREACAGIVALNVSAQELGNVLGDPTCDWTARTNRALFIDRHANTTTLTVPFVKPGRLEEDVSL